MYTIEFQGLGTVWSIMIDTAPNLNPVAQGLREEIIRYARDFESRFSRFLSESETNAFRDKEAGIYTVSAEFARLLERAATLRTLSSGTYDPVVGGVLEEAGYGAQHGIQPLVYGEELPTWSILGDQLTIGGPIAFDLGGIGKGYCIDRIADIIYEAGYVHFIVDGGGDMFGTTKADGKPWRVAIEYPGKPDTAASLIELAYHGLAVSDRCRRQFGKQHHLMDLASRQSVTSVVGCAAVAPDAWSADCMTSGLFLSTPNRYRDLAQALRAEYLVFQSDNRVLVSQNWDGELF